MGNPMPFVPEIQRPFQVKCKVRLNAVSSAYHAIFHWVDIIEPSSILVGYGTGGFLLQIRDDLAGSLDCLDSSMPMVPGPNLPTLEFSWWTGCRHE